MSIAKKFLAYLEAVIYDTQTSNLALGLPVLCYQMKQLLRFYTGVESPPKIWWYLANQLKHHSRVQNSLQYLQQMHRIRSCLPNAATKLALRWKPIHTCCYQGKKKYSWVKKIQEKTIKNTYCEFMDYKHWDMMTFYHIKDVIACHAWDPVRALEAIKS